MSSVEEQEKRAEGLVTKAADILDSAGAGISQRPTAWTAITIVSAFCLRDGLVLWFFAPKLSGIIDSMCKGIG